MLEDKSFLPSTTKLNYEKKNLKKSIHGGRKSADKKKLPG